MSISITEQQCRWQFFDNSNIENLKLLNPLISALYGSCILVFITSLIVVPLGIALGVYLHFYAHPLWRSCVHFHLNLLMSVPSILVGFFGFLSVVLLRSYGFTDLRMCLGVASLTLAFLVLPLLVKKTEHSFELVGKEKTLHALALGISRFEILLYVIFPQASRGILGSVLLTTARIFEDTAVVILTGAVYNAGFPLSMSDKFSTLSFHIFYLSAEYRKSEEFYSMFIAAFILVVVSVLLQILVKKSFTVWERAWQFQRKS